MGDSGGGSASFSRDVLVFDKDARSTLTTTITDADGAGHAVEYRFYKAITYVTKPVDEAYRSLNVSVPVKIDGMATDVTILFTGDGAGAGASSGSASPSASASSGRGSGTGSGPRLG